MTEPEPVTADQWRWFGYPAHFIGAADCHFHLATQVGKFLVSTVGDHRPGDKTTNRQEIGHERYFETFVFRVDGQRECGCPDMDCTELDTRGYGNDAQCQELNDGHLAMCRKWAALQDYKEKSDG